MKNLSTIEKQQFLLFRNCIKQSIEIVFSKRSKVALLIKSLSFLFFFIFNLNLQGQSTSLYNIQLEVNEIKYIEYLHERAAAWLIYAYKTTTTHPKDIKTKLSFNQPFLPEKYPHLNAIILLTEAEVNNVQGNHNQATKNVARAIQILESKELRTVSEKKLLALAYVTFARFSNYSRDVNGLNYAYKALKLATEINYPTAKTFAHNQIGLIISYFKNDKVLALEHFEKSKELLPHIPSSVYDFINGFIFGNIAKTWAELGDIEKSINYKLALLANEKNHQNIELMLGTNNNLGTNYYDLKKYDLAQKYLQKTLDLMDKHQIYTNQGIPLYRMGLIQLEKGNLLQARSYADAIDYWLINHQFIGGYLVSFYQLKSKIAKADMDFEQAILWLEKASDEQESINKLNNNNLIKLEEENKIIEIQEERILLEKERSTIYAQKVLIIAIGILAFLSILFIFIFYKQKVQLKKAYKFILSNSQTDSQNTNSNKNLENKTIDINLKQKITKALKEDQLYLLPDLNLKKFADHLNSNTSYVSKTINEGFGKNFSALINEYRIEKVLQLFQSGEHKTYTIESIYKKAGFKSKSSFQKSFKAQMGVTASYYIEHLSKTA